MSSTYRYLSGDHLAFEPKVNSLVGTHTPYCWGCGSEAEQGLGLQPRLDGSQVRADLEFARRFEGGPGTVHGGAITAFMDDLLGYVPVAYGAPGVTAKLDTNFIAPVPMGVTVAGTAWMSRIDGSKMWAEGAIEVEGHVLVESSALFIAIGPDHYQRVFDGFTEEQLERFGSYRSADYYP
jgi:acyl-coenzyme A thioesterase PaaI-like protein